MLLQSPSSFEPDTWYNLLEFEDSTWSSCKVLLGYEDPWIDDDDAETADDVFVIYDNLVITRFGEVNVADWNIHKKSTQCLHENRSSIRESGFLICMNKPFGF